MQKWNNTSFAVLDPTINSGSQYINVLKHFLNLNYKGKLSLQVRLEMVTSEFSYLVAELNKTGMCLLEFGLQSIHPDEQKVIQRPNNMKKINKVIAEVNEMKIPYEVSIIYGLPNQTLNSYLETIEYLNKRNVPVIKTFPLMLLRGTDLYDRKKELGLVENYEVWNYEIDRIQDRIPHVVFSPSFSYLEGKEMSRIAGYLSKSNKYFNLI